MLKIIRNFLPILMLFALALACVSPSAAPSAPGLDQNAINLAIEQTSAAAKTQTAQAQPISISLTPTLTKFPTMTLLPTFTPVVFVTLMRVTQNTNCRAGPGKVYPVVAGFRAGDFAEVVGRSADAKYWIVHNPTHPDRICWLAGNITDVTGVVGALKVMTPPPTPKPTRTNTPKPKPTRTATPKSTSTVSLTAIPVANFSASYYNMASCTGTSWWVNIHLQNISNTTFMSMALILTDTDATPNTVLTLYADEFVDRGGCGVSHTEYSLPSRSDIFVSAPDFTYDPTGHNLRAEITLCSDPGQTGTCAKQTINFIP